MTQHRDPADRFYQLICVGIPLILLALVLLAAILHVA
jgi:hypothetical protein